VSSMIYIFRDRGVAGCVKIGRDTAWPKRLEQARCHTPRGIEAVACWRFDGATTTALNEAERRAQAGLPRRPGDTREWFDVGADEAVRALSTRFGRAPDLREPTPDLGDYDDWRSKGMNRWRFRLWLFVEASPEARLKVIYSCLNDTIYRYAFTYNPFPVYLVDAWELVDDLPAAPHSTAFLEHNARVEAAWAEIVARQACGVPASSVGWLAAGTDPAVLARELAGRGFVPYRLDRPKPADARLRDPSLNPPTPVGAVPPQGRVRPLALEGRG